jgi:bacillithiol biosynthesis deacetylase BshB1
MNHSIRDEGSIVPCDIVAFSAHPDDMEICCGGTLALAARQGWKAGAVEFTRGELGTRGTPEIRSREADEAATVLGLACRLNLEQPDGHLHDTDDARKLVVRVLRRMRPRVVIAPPLRDHHADHIAVAQVVAHSMHLSTVAKYAPGLEPWRPSVLLHYVTSRSAVPSMVIDISSVYELRMQAMMCHRSQFYNPGSTERETRIAHPEFPKAVEGRLRHFGALIGVSHGEAYTIEEPVPVTDVVRLYSRTPWAPPARSS